MGPRHELGSSGISISRVGFGCGDAAGLMVGDDQQLQVQTVGRALELGVTYFDTASKYGQGRSELALGHALAQHRADVVVGSKLELDPAATHPFSDQVKRGLSGTLKRLGRERVELYQLHDRIDLPGAASWAPPGARRLTPAEVLAPGGLGDALVAAQEQGLVGALGLTTFGGHPDAVAEVIKGGLFDALNASVHMLNPTALRAPGRDWPKLDYGGIAGTAAKLGMGVLAIRALASGRLVGLGASARFREFDHPDVLWTPQVRNAAAAAISGRGDSAQAAVSWVLASPSISAVISGVSVPAHIEAAVEAASARIWTADEAAAWTERLLDLPADEGSD